MQFRIDVMGKIYIKTGLKYRNMFCCEHMEHFYLVLSPCALVHKLMACGCFVLLYYRVDDMMVFIAWLVVIKTILETKIQAKV